MLKEEHSNINKKTRK